VPVLERGPIEEVRKLGLRFYRRLSFVLFIIDIIMILGETRSRAN